MVQTRGLCHDFNPDAVINLYGLDNNQRREVLKEVAGEGYLYRKIIRSPLLIKKPDISGLISFITKTQRSY
jgi:hypothetical protein